MSVTQRNNEELNSAITTIEGVVSDSSGHQELSGVVSRLTKTFLRDLLSVDLSNSADLLSSMDDHELLAFLVVKGIEREPIASNDAKMKLEGRIAFREMLSEHGGVLSQQQAAEMLGIQSGGVRKRVERGKLLAVKQGDHHVYPVFQFGDNGEIVPQFDEVLQLLDTTSEVAKVRFFLNQSSDLSQSVIEALKDGEQLELIKRKAETFGIQGAV